MRLRPLLCQSSVLLSELRGYGLDFLQFTTIVPRKSSTYIDAAFQTLMTHNTASFAMIRVSRFIDGDRLPNSVAGVFAGIEIPFIDEVRKGSNGRYLAAFDIESSICHTEFRYSTHS